MQEVFDYLPRVPALARYRPEEIAVERLAGLTNRNYKLSLPEGGAVVLRIPGEGTAAYIDRKAEAQNAKIAAEAGVSAPLVYFDAESGLQVTRFIEGAVTMNGERFRDLGSVARAARAFRQMHECGRRFATRFELFQMIDSYLGLLNGRGARIPDGYAAVQREAEAAREALGRHNLPLAPCHCDPLCENFLDTGTRMWILDWEYAGNNDPMWDLGDLSVEAGYGPEQDAAQMEAYFEGRAPAFETGRMVMYKALCDLLWTLWGCIQVMNENPVDDFWAYAINRFERCQRLMGATDFGRHLDAVRRGG
ncbi:MAG: phosphotransferase [Hyphomicrobium sp.]|uniref:phosphotransferase n=1 Tax=Hyphomicrobium sp. TaxID=82 RepID=UPI003D0D4570